MWRRTAALLGRWGPRDFLRGRSKNAGSVHTRHTHGSKGRYKRLSSMYGIRDGRRHAGNRLHGGLGIKLGGGLFGMRAPRQHLLSTLTPEEYELEMYGHPNITNPYRHHLSEHPDLQSVLDDAAMAVQLVVLLPRVARGGDAVQGVVPDAWGIVMREVRTAVASFMNVHDVEGSGITATTTTTTIDDATAAQRTRRVQRKVTVYLATLQASLCLRNMTSMHSSNSLLAQLYTMHSRGHRIAPHELTTATAVQDKHASHSSPHTRRVLPFLCGAMKLPIRGITSHMTTSQKEQEEGENDVVCTTGVQELLRGLCRDSPDALRLCARVHLPAMATVRGDASVGRGAGRSALLKKDVDRDETVGVWGLARSDAARLVRWHYLRNDPRAHCADALPHHQRCLSVTLFLDASKTAAPPWSDHMVQEEHRRVASLLPHRFGQELATMGYRAIAQEDMTTALRAVREWSTAHPHGTPLPAHAHSSSAHVKA